MRRSGTTGQRLVAIFLMGGALLNFPILFLFAQPSEVAGLPLLYVYVLGVWVLLIGLMALVIERTRD